MRSIHQLLACAPALLLITAACEDTNPSGSGPTPFVPSVQPVQGGTPPGASEPAASDRATPTAAGEAKPATPPSGTVQPAGALTDGQIAAVVDGLNKGEIDEAKVARSKSKSKDVLGFASMMIEHHGQAQKKQTALKETPEPSPLSAQLSSEAQATLTRLNQANGADFDRAYLEAQVEGHQKALETLTQKLLPSARSPELTKYLRELQPRIEQHLSRARTLRDGLASTPPRSGAKGENRPASMQQK